ncbi:hypothetical protein CAAN1_22S02366 [[Candida] anglica]|uniref:VPS9 domain-containing protein n=1 Tax=[Candida] anglica TaxID=148631 RepID=A0ABP0E9G7_9ASCO
MSFYIVPAMSYQTQQKMKGKKKGKRGKKHRSSQDGAGSSDNASTTSSGHKPSVSESVVTTATSTSGGGGGGSSQPDDSSRSSQADDLASIHSSGLTPAAEIDETGGPRDKSVVSSRNNSTYSGSSGNSGVLSMSRLPSSGGRTYAGGGERRGSGSVSSAPATFGLQRIMGGGHRHSVGDISSRSSGRQSSLASNMEESHFEGDKFPNHFKAGGQVKPTILTAPTTPMAMELDQSPFSSPLDDKFIITDKPTIPTPVPTTPRNTHVKTPPSEKKVPLYVPVTDLAMLNSPESIYEHFYAPPVQVDRWSRFKDIIGGFHRHDPINFAKVRYNSLVKFSTRVRATVPSDGQSVFSSDGTGTKETEYSLAHELFRIRHLLRNLIYKYSVKESNKVEIISCEELIQVNFTNYIRYILELPDIKTLDPNEVTEELKEHYYYKEYFSTTQERLYSLLKEESGEESPPGEVDSTGYFIQLVMRLSYEFILLETYSLQILCKLNDNFMVEQRALQGLFGRFKENQAIAEKGQPFESVKVLCYNTYFSAFYGWYLAVLNPFVQVIESNVYCEDSELVTDIAKYDEARKSKQREREEGNNIQLFSRSESEMYEDFFSKVRFNDFAQYQKCNAEKLMGIHQTIEDTIKSKHANSENKDDIPFLHKPHNFEFYTKSLSTIPESTFDHIQSRDLTIELTPENYKVVLREFHRILKVGGHVEIPTIHIGGDSLKGLLDSEFSDCNLRKWSSSGLQVTQIYNLIPNYVECVLRELADIFGESNVKYGIVFLNMANDVNSYLMNYILMRIFETAGRINEYDIEEHNDSGGSKEEGIHYFVKIIAEKV